MVAKRDAPLGDLLRDLRRKREWTQDDLAAAVTAAGVSLSASQVTHVETGRRTLSLEKGEAVADVFELEGDERYRFHFARARQREIIQRATATPDSNRRATEAALRAAEARYEEMMQEFLRLDAVGEDVSPEQEVIRQALYSEIHDLRRLLRGDPEEDEARSQREDKLSAEVAAMRAEVAAMRSVLEKLQGRLPGAPQEAPESD